MTHRTTFLSGLPLALLLGTAVLGQYVVAAEPSAAVVAKLDQDNDKTLDWAEVAAGASARFDNKRDQQQRRSQPEAAHRLSERR